MTPAQCVILAGGLATRMRPITEKIPKSLIPVAGKPFIEHQLTWLRKHGVDDIILSVGYRSEMLKDHVGDGSKWGVKVRFVDEGQNLRGTGGALRLCFEQGVLNPEFLVTYGDSFLPIDFSIVWSAFLSQNLPAMMVVYQNEGKFDTSNVWYSEGKIHLYDKHKQHPEAFKNLQYIDYGLSVFKRSVIESRVLSGTKVDLADVFYNMSREELLAGFEVTTRFYEIGSRQGLADLERYLDHLIPTVKIT